MHRTPTSQMPPPPGWGRGGGGSRCYCVGRSWCPVHFSSSVRGGENCTGHGLLLTRWCRFDGHLGKRVGKYSRLLISPRRKARAFCSLTSELEHSHVCTHRPLTVRAMRIPSVSPHCQCASTCLDARSHRWIAATQLSWTPGPLRVPSACVRAPPSYAPQLHVCPVRASEDLKGGWRPLHYF